ncbi:hypothetical protein MLD38_010425 [Melastoma candidum]|uniref:Uncharacterized protein n=1 Tax=Melastoma candidum TaxID=119954 RepID=A0ACB9R3B1_9MYRT|nr:hypothetical protein MLD38_010425 [Melastoma candidum]
MGSCCLHVRSSHFFPSPLRNPSRLSLPSFPFRLPLNSGSSSQRFSVDYIPRSFFFSDGSGRGSGGGGHWWNWGGDNGPGDGGGGGSALETNSMLLFLFVLSRAFRSSTAFKFLDGFGLFMAVSALSFFFELQLPSATLARTEGDSEDDREGGGIVVWEVKGGKWTKLVGRVSEGRKEGDDDVFVVAGDSMQRLGLTRLGSLVEVRDLLKELVVTLMLPEGFPDSVTSDYLEYSLWRGVQGVASQISGVLATQALLYAVGLGKGAIPTAAAINWVLKDGIGYVSKIFLSKFGRHFDVHPKGWRLFADLLENAAFGLEMLTPAFPHLFVPVGAAAGASRSAAALIQAATRSCFYAGFAAQRNFAEVIAKGEAQGMVSKAIGIGIGIALANCIGSSTPLAMACFTAVTWVHMFCNLRSYQSIHLRTLNPYRGNLLFSEYLLSGEAPSVKEVNDEEPLFPVLPSIGKSSKQTNSGLLSLESKAAAAEIEQRLLLGSKLSDVINTEEDAVALFNLFIDEGYILTEHLGRFCVFLKENSSPQDMLKSLFHVNYLYWLERNAGILPKNVASDCNEGGRLRMSLEFVQREFKHAKDDAEAMGWVTEGLIARPLPNRIRVGYMSASQS